MTQYFPTPDSYQDDAFQRAVVLISTHIRPGLRILFRSRPDHSPSDNETIYAGQLETAVIEKIKRGLENSGWLVYYEAETDNIYAEISIKGAR